MWRFYFKSIRDFPRSEKDCIAPPMLSRRIACKPHLHRLETPTVNTAGAVLQYGDALLGHADRWFTSFHQKLPGTETNMACRTKSCTAQLDPQGAVTYHLTQSSAHLTALEKWVDCSAPTHFWNKSGSGFDHGLGSSLKIVPQVSW